MPNWFAAIPVELPESFMAMLRSGMPRGLRWFAPEDVHVTVAFFGAWRAERFASVHAAVGALPAPDIEITTGPLLVLPSPRRFSALSLSVVAGGGVLKAYAGHCHAPLMQAAGLTPDPRETLPHLTIARPERRASHRERREILKWAEKLAVPPLKLRLNRLAILGWAEDRSVRQFRVLEETGPAME